MTQDGSDTDPGPAPADEAPRPDLSNKRVLLVSTHMGTRTLLTDVLMDLGFCEVVGEEDVGSGLLRLRGAEFDLLVSDMEAQRMEEVDLVRNALALDPDLPILVVSAFATIEWGVELMKAGVRDVVRKPLDVPVFREKVFRIMERTEEEDDLPARIGPYRVLEEIERGGMGIIYKAVDPDTGETVALKVLPTTAPSSMKPILRFRKEAETIARLNHPYIVRLKSNGFSGKRYFLAMEFIHGTALDVLAYERGLEWPRLAPIFEKILDALEYAHKRNILHRDLKPSNILVDEVDDPHIIDFGLAQYLKGDVRLTKTGVVMGTIGYIAPERIRGRPATASSDVYSAGAILYECLTRRIPYESDSRVITIPTSFDDLVTPRSVVPQIPERLERICLKALAIAPEKRYPDAASIRRDVQAFLETL